MSTARHYDPDVDIQQYDDCEVIVQRDANDDGVPIVRIEALYEPDETYAFGPPGVSIEMTLDEAITLMARLSEITFNEVSS